MRRQAGRGAAARRGALVAKAAAYAAYGVGDAARDRHLVDFAVLASMVTRSDGIADHVTSRDRRNLRSVLSALDAKRSLWTMVDGAERRVDVVGHRRPLSARW